MKLDTANQPHPLQAYLQQSFEGVHQLQDWRQRVSSRGDPFLDLDFLIQGRPVRVFQWNTQISDLPWRLEPGGRYWLCMHVWTYCGGFYGAVVDAQLRPSVPAHQVASDAATTPAAEEDRLQALIAQCGLDPLRQFLADVLDDRTTRQAFETLPASQNHHHAYPGGLLEHSLEVAQIIHRVMSRDDPVERALTETAGLLHDIGKIRTHQPDGRYQPLGYLLRHDQLTLEILAGPLQRLEKEWRDGAMGLRYLLSYHLDPREVQRPRMTGALALTMADRLRLATSCTMRPFIVAAPRRPGARPGPPPIRPLRPIRSGRGTVPGWVGR